MDIFSVFAGVGGLLSLVIMALAAITPIMIYLIQRNTYQNRQELRKVNKNLETLHYLLGKQSGMLHDFSFTTSNIEQDTHSNQGGMELGKDAIKKEEPVSNAVTMTCEYCGKIFKYGISHSGKEKPCPGCKKTILLK